MPIVPSGKRRLMFAQTSPGPAHEQAGELDFSGMQPGQTQIMDQPAPEEAPQDDAVAAEDPAAAGNDPAAQGDPAAQADPAGEVDSQVQQQQAAQQQGGKEGDVRQTVFEFLVDLGYPPRRLNEFKSQFVSETGSASSGTVVAIVIPDEVYGKNMQIPRDKMKQFVQIVEQKHGLSFQDYKRANEQLTFNFMTADAAAQSAMENAGPGDILDKVYGKPGGKGGKGKMNPKAAQTIQEMMKESKARQHETLLKILGAKR